MLLDRLNRWTAGRLKILRDERRGCLAVTETGITIRRNGQSRAVAWTAIERIIATKEGAYVGDVIGLTIVAAGDAIGQASEHDPEWRDLIAGIVAYLPGCLPYARWTLELVASAGGSIKIYDRGTYPDLN